MTWHWLAESAEVLNWQDNEIAVAEINGKKICVARYRDEYHAFAHTCPHAGGILSAGWIDPLGNVVCPLHRYKFSLKNGRNTSGEGYYLRTYPVEFRETGMFVGMPETGISLW